MTMPIYTGCNPPDQYLAGGHAGLWYDRFFNQYKADWSVPDGGKLEWIKQVTLFPLGGERVQAFIERQKLLVKACEGESIIATTDWHFVTGLGNNHPVENGFAWHPTLGVPYLTGAAVKGMLRGWCEQWAGLDANTLRLWFGPSLDELDKKTANPAAGELIFFDALPTGPVKLKPDVMTPHYGDWYEKGDEAPKKDGSNLPADWHSPVPVPFLVVAPGQAFQFSVATRHGSNILIGDVVKEMKSALTYLGAGAKTAVGYGIFKMPMEGVSEEAHPETISAPTRHKVGDKVRVIRVEDPKGKGRVWWQAENGLGGVVLSNRGSVPQVAIGETAELWIAASLDNGYNFSAEPIPQGTRKPVSQRKGKRT
jgi:CRISPR-associated protein Cmr6